MMKLVDSIYADLEDLLVGYELKYNKFYIGLSINGVSKNFIAFKPMKKFIIWDSKDMRMKKLVKN